MRCGKTRPPYAAEFRQQIVELYAAGRTRRELSKEFGYSERSVLNWAKQAGTVVALPDKGAAVLRTHPAECRKVVGWSIGEDLRPELVLAALDMAVVQRAAEAVVIHSDKGCLYTSVKFGQRCHEMGVQPSTWSGRGRLRQRHG